MRLFVSAWRRDYTPRSMTAPNALFVRIRNAEGKYLAGESGSMGFTKDINRAIIFDCRRDQIDAQLELIRSAQGVTLEVVPVDPNEIHETCDHCGKFVFSFQAFFDGQKFLCPECQAKV